MKYVQRVLHNKGLLSMWKRFTRDFFFKLEEGKLPDSRFPSKLRREQSWKKLVNLRAQERRPNEVWDLIITIEFFHCPHALSSHQWSSSIINLDYSWENYNGYSLFKETGNSKTKREMEMTLREIKDSENYS